MPTRSAVRLRLSVSTCAFGRTGLHPRLGLLSEPGDTIGLADKWNVTAATPANQPPGALSSAGSRFPWASGPGFMTNNFDVMRFALASLVILSHAFPLVLGPDPSRGDPVKAMDARDPFYDLAQGQATMGTLAVYGFFLLSGFLIINSYDRSKSFTGYLMKRVVRIYPAFLVATALSAVAAAVGGADVLGLKNLALDAANALGLGVYFAPDAFAGNPLPGAVNGSMWTIRYEFGCYLIAALVGAVLLRGRWLTALFAAFWCVVAAAVYWTGWRADYAALGEVFGPLRHLGRLEPFVGDPRFWPKLMAFFFTGVAFWRWRDSIPHSDTLGLASLALFVAGVFVPGAMFLVGPLALTYLLLWIAYHPSLDLRGFGRRGDFSYGIYLYAFPIQQLLVWSGLMPTGDVKAVWANFLLAWPLAIVAGAASWYVIEKPALAFKPKPRA